MSKGDPIEDHMEEIARAELEGINNIEEKIDRNLTEREKAIFCNGFNKGMLFSFKKMTEEQDE